MNDMSTFCHQKECSTCILYNRQYLQFLTIVILLFSLLQELYHLGLYSHQMTYDTCDNTLFFKQIYVLQKFSNKSKQCFIIKTLVFIFVRGFQ